MLRNGGPCGSTILAGTPDKEGIAAGGSGGGACRVNHVNEGGRVGGGGSGYAEASCEKGSNTEGGGEGAVAPPVLVVDQSENGDGWPAPEVHQGDRMRSISLNGHKEEKEYERGVEKGEYTPLGGKGSNNGEEDGREPEAGAPPMASGVNEEESGTVASVGGAC